MVFDEHIAAMIVPWKRTVRLKVVFQVKPFDCKAYFMARLLLTPSRRQILHIESVQARFQNPPLGGHQL